MAYSHTTNYSRLHIWHALVQGLPCSKEVVSDGGKHDKAGANNCGFYGLTSTSEHIEVFKEYKYNTAAPLYL